MKTYTLAQNTLNTGRVAYGCMRLADLCTPATTEAEHLRAASAVVDAATAAGISLFDHADIYCAGRSELLFGRVLATRPGLRDRIIVQTKCGIRFPGDMVGSVGPARYDFSHDHIVRSAEDSLRRLGLDTIDIFLLHRPDPLAEPAEVARAFDHLHSTGKVRHFGVSNYSAAQIRRLARCLRQPIVVNQVEFSLGQPALVVDGISINQHHAGAASGLAEGLLDYCALHNIRVQAWGPLAAGRARENATLETVLQEISATHHVTEDAIMLAWILRHPQGIQPVLGSLRIARIQAAADANAITLSREEWYRLLEAARGARVP